MAFKLLDAQAALGFVTSQTSYIERQVNETVYPDIQYPQLVPVDTSANPWAKTVTYYSADKYGKADWINGNADDIPMAGTEMARNETAVYTAGIGYGYGLEEISQAQMLGLNLPAQDALAARRAYEEMVDRVAIYGDTSKGFYGLINAPSVTAGTAVTGNWETATPAQILADINSELIGQYNATLNTAMADTLLLPYGRWLLLTTRMVSDLATETLFSWITRNNAYTAATGQPLKIRAIRGLDTAGAGGTARMVAYRRDPSVVKIHIPMPHRFLPVYQAGPIRWEVPGIFRLGGVDVRQPLLFSYTDGI
nr:major capsid family protein [Pseudomonas luteola]